ncbi:MAG: hypothetical protein JRJ85_02970 [Deltaproteobacteria bacterium]|nr:hypothetical protein [Deltaproteobacteria bacterium]
MILSFHPCFAADHQIILGSRGLNEEDTAHIQRAEVVILPQTCPRKLYEMCKKFSALIFPNYDKRFQYEGKIGQSRLFKICHYPHPETTPWTSVTRFRISLEKRQNPMPPFPYLIKTDHGHETEGVYLIENRESLNVALDRLEISERSGRGGFIVQELVASEGNVLRAVILDQRVISYWKRPLKPGQIITSAATGARIDGAWRADLRMKGETHARNFSSDTGTNLAAIDFVFPLREADPQPLFLEINYYFGRRGLGGSENYYRLLRDAIRDWLKRNGFNPNSVTLL